MILLAHRYDREADRCFAEACRLNPTQARWPYARGLIALKRDPDHALPFLRQAIACNANSDEHTAMQLQLAEALLARQELDEAERLFREEWQLLHRALEPNEPLPTEPPSLREAVRQIARLGGFLARRGDGEPGVKTIWRGLRRLEDLLIGWKLAVMNSPPNVVGKE